MTARIIARSNGFGGLAQQMPIYAGITGFAFFAAMGLPGLSAFISEVLVLIGAWQPHPIMTVLGAATAILTAGYMLWCFQRIYLGPLNEKYQGLPDLSLREAFTLVPLGVIVLILGVYPHAILTLLEYLAGASQSDRAGRRPGCDRGAALGFGGNRDDGSW